MKAKPILTEKSLQEAERGVYSFWVPKNLTKYQIRELIGKTYNVPVARVRTASYKVRQRRNIFRKIVATHARKKALVTLKNGKTIDVFGKAKGKK